MSSRLRSLRVYCVPCTAIGSHLQSFFKFLFVEAGGGGARECRYLWRPEVEIRYPEAGGTGGGDLFNIDFKKCAG